ncbi:alkaline phosphatase [Teredinibacter sp. KSP-S5-2]|uniref:alkaline phosphatase n=1 Tax=Teredinibacter sp. KSP-S5-2 TaxID=3034506 RepID=UPI002934BFEB|nr:alkaline phosphatase [Teredinibacter sp. KSP-S5-2]WNO10086.1 alkaline phosphatase [Teredinibacter sp. KSP-S5-2]
MRFSAAVLSLCFASSFAVQSVASSSEWYASGEEYIQARLAVTKNTNRAKNVIVFIGDGMGVSTVTAARIFDGQSRGASGEENVLPFETFPHVGLVKTYNVNQQVPDSAGTASAIHTGVKTRAGVLGVSGDAPRGDCVAAKAHRVANMAEVMKKQGKRVGVVTSTRVTHATPASVYAHIPDRNWEASGDVPAEAAKAGCLSIARQLVEFNQKGAIDVSFGGGKKEFTEEELAHWQKRGTLVESGAQMASLSSKDLPVLGLFSSSHMPYVIERQEESAVPSLSDMAVKAVELLSKNKKGFYLLVEGGRIDHGHHSGQAGKALAEAQEFAEAVKAVLAKVDLSETLVIVTADHSHVLSMGGYPTRGNPILGVVKSNDEHGEPKTEPETAFDNQPYTTLGYYNGPGAVKGARAKPETGLHAVQQALVPTGYEYHGQPYMSETHGGEDVPIYAIGPYSHLVGGVMEQNVIFHIVRYAVKQKK